MRKDLRDSYQHALAEVIFSVCFSPMFDATLPRGSTTSHKPGIFGEGLGPGIRFVGIS